MKHLEYMDKAVAALEKLASIYSKADKKNHQAVSAVIRDADGKILVVDHLKHKQFSIPLGKVDAGETPREAIARELEEELGIVIKKYRQLKSHHNTFMVDGAPVKVKTHIYEVTEYDKKPKNKEPKKHRSVKWLTRREIRNISNITPTTKAALDQLSK